MTFTALFPPPKRTRAPEQILVNGYDLAAKLAEINSAGGRVEVMDTAADKKSDYLLHVVLPTPQTP